jgi:DNA-binding protein
MSNGNQNIQNASSAPASAGPQPQKNHNAKAEGANNRQPPKEENTIFVGKKPTMGYVLACVTQFQAGAQWVKLRARGQVISKAVDVAEIVRNKFIPGVQADSVLIGTEEVENEDGTKSKVSTIEITLKK